MKFGIIADIHSNFEGLEAVLQELNNLDKVFCLGDIVGYGPNPNECVELVQKKKIESVAGNHDWAVLKKIDLSWFNPYAAEAVRINKQLLTEENKKFLAILPVQSSFANTLFVHGSPRDPITEYIFDGKNAAVNFPIFGQQICFVGHTHRPVVFQRIGDEFSSFVPKEAKKIKLNEKARYIINPGAVGQPRDGNSAASFLIFDSEDLTIELKRVSYPLEITQEKMRQLNFPKNLIQRLAVGR